MNTRKKGAAYEQTAIEYLQGRGVVILRSEEHTSELQSQ